MARRRREVSNNIPSKIVPPPVVVLKRRYHPVIVPAVTLRMLEDRRTFHPLAAARPVGVFSARSQRQLVERPPQAPKRALGAFPALRLGFAVPDKVVRCVRRKTRREALFATNRTGKGAASKRRRRDEWSDVKC